MLLTWTLSRYCQVLTEIKKTILENSLSQTNHNFHRITEKIVKVIESHFPGQEETTVGRMSLNGKHCFWNMTLFPVGICGQCRLKACCAVCKQATGCLCRCSYDSKSRGRGLRSGLLVCPRTSSGQRAGLNGRLHWNRSTGTKNMISLWNQYEDNLGCTYARYVSQDKTIQNTTWQDSLRSLVTVHCKTHLLFIILSSSLSENYRCTAVGLLLAEDSRLHREKCFSCPSCQLAEVINFFRVKCPFYSGEISDFCLPD